MTHVDDRVLELARTALGFEFGGEHFFRHAAAMTKNPAGQALFLRLAEEENGRIDALHTLFESLIGDDAWRRLVAEERAAINPSQIVADVEAGVAQRGHAVVADDTQALRLAMELERRIIGLYKTLAEHSTDPVVLGLIGNMLDEETFQYDNFQAQLDSVLNVGVWLDAPEFRMDAKY